MPYFNRKKFGSETKVLVENPFNESSTGEAVGPPPGQNFIVTEVVQDFVVSEGGADFMITEI